MNNRVNVISNQISIKLSNQTESLIERTINRYKKIVLNINEFYYRMKNSSLANLLKLKLFIYYANLIRSFVLGNNSVYFYDKNDSLISKIEKGITYFSSGIAKGMVIIVVHLLFIYYEIFLLMFMFVLLVNYTFDYVKAYDRLKLNGDRSELSEVMMYVNRCICSW